MSETKQSEKNEKNEKKAKAPVAEALPKVDQAQPAAPAAPAAPAEPVQPAQDLTLKLSAKKAGREARVMKCLPETAYSIPLGEGDKAVQVPFMLPPSCHEQVDVVIASANPNWLGRDGEVLNIHVCSSEQGTVILQPHGKGYKANVFSRGRITVGRSA